MEVHQSHGLKKKIKAKELTCVRCDQKTSLIVIVVRRDCTDDPLLGASQKRASCLLLPFQRYTNSKRLSAAKGNTRTKGKKKTRRTRSALSRRFTFPPDVLVLIVVIRVSLLFRIFAITVHRIRIVLLRLVACCPLARRRRGRRVYCRCSVANRRPRTAHAFWAEPFAVRYGGQGRGEARVVISFIALFACLFVCERGRE